MFADVLSARGLQYSSEINVTGGLYELFLAGSLSHGCLVVSTAR